MKFSIYVPTYNRKRLLGMCLRSLVLQTYKNFEVFVHDNGSSRSVKEDVDGLNDGRFSFTRSETPTDTNENAEAALEKASGDIFLFLSDDDALVPNALEVVAAIFESSPSVEYLSVGLAHYNHDSKAGYCATLHGGKLLEFDAFELAVGYANGSTAIGKWRGTQLPSEAHPSGIFLGTALINRTKERQGRLFLRPFGDVGYLGCLLQVETSHHFDAPLAVIGDSSRRETAGARRGQRSRLEGYRGDLYRSPLRALTFINLALESHLKVFFENNLSDEVDLRIRPDFFQRHVREILGDRPRNKQTYLDLLECLPRYVTSLLEFASLEKVIRYLRSVLGRLKKLYSERVHRAKNLVGSERPAIGPDKRSSFEDINEYAVKLVRRFEGPEQKL